MFSCKLYQTHALLHLLWFWQEPQQWRQSLCSPCIYILTNDGGGKAKLVDDGCGEDVYLHKQQWWLVDCDDNQLLIYLLVPTHPCKPTPGRCYIFPNTSHHLLDCHHHNHEDGFVTKRNKTPLHEKRNENNRKQQKCSDFFKTHRHQFVTNKQLILIIILN